MTRARDTPRARRATKPPSPTSAAHLLACVAAWLLRVPALASSLSTGHGARRLRVCVPHLSSAVLVGSRGCVVACEARGDGVFFTRDVLLPRTCVRGASRHIALPRRATRGAAVCRLTCFLPLCGVFLGCFRGRDPTTPSGPLQLPALRRHGREIGIPPPAPVRRAPRPIHELAHPLALRSSGPGRRIWRHCRSHPSSGGAQAWSR